MTTKFSTPTDPTAVFYTKRWHTVAEVQAGVEMLRMLCEDLDTDPDEDQISMVYLLVTGLPDRKKADRERLDAECRTILEERTKKSGIHLEWERSTEAKKDTARDPHHMFAVPFQSAKETKAFVKYLAKQKDPKAHVKVMEYHSAFKAGQAAKPKATATATPTGVASGARKATPTPQKLFATPPASTGQDEFMEFAWQLYLKQGGDPDDQAEFDVYAVWLYTQKSKQEAKGDTKPTARGTKRRKP